MLLITKDGIFYPTMSMKTKEILRLSHDVIESESVVALSRSEILQLGPSRGRMTVEA